MSRINQLAEMLGLMRQNRGRIIDELDAAELNCDSALKACEADPENIELASIAARAVEHHERLVDEFRAANEDIEEKSKELKSLTNK